MPYCASDGQQHQNEQADRQRPCETIAAPQKPDAVDQNRCRSARRRSLLLGASASGSSSDRPEAILPAFGRGVVERRFVVVRHRIILRGGCLDRVAGIRCFGQLPPASLRARLRRHPCRPARCRRSLCSPRDIATQANVFEELRFRTIAKCLTPRLASWCWGRGACRDRRSPTASACRPSDRRSGWRRSPPSARSRCPSASSACRPAW